MDLIHLALLEQLKTNSRCHVCLACTCTTYQNQILSLFEIVIRFCLSLSEGLELEVLTVSLVAEVLS